MFKKKQAGIIFGSDININIKRKLILKKVSIKISKKRIDIKAPYFLSDKSLDQLINSKKFWINKQLDIQYKSQLFKKKEYVNGENFLYLGEIYKLKIIVGDKFYVKIKDNFLLAHVKDKEDIAKIKKLISKWYLTKSLIYFKEQTENYALANNLALHSVKVRNYKARWGSCSVKGDISFNWRLIMSPLKIIKYVIIHELMHLKEHNHSPKYWDHVKILYPDVKEAKEWLMYNGQTLNI